MSLSLTPWSCPCCPQSMSVCHLFIEETEPASEREPRRGRLARRQLHECHPPLGEGEMVLVTSTGVLWLSTAYVTSSWARSRLASAITMCARDLKCVADDERERRAAACACSSYWSSSKSTAPGLGGPRYAQAPFGGRACILTRFPRFCLKLSRLQTNKTKAPLQPGAQSASDSRNTGLSAQQAPA